MKYFMVLLVIAGLVLGCGNDVEVKPIAIEAGETETNDCNDQDTITKSEAVYFIKWKSKPTKQNVVKHLIYDGYGTSEPIATIAAPDTECAISIRGDEYYRFSVVAVNNLGQHSGRYWLKMVYFTALDDPMVLQDSCRIITPDGEVKNEAHGYY